jgi:hypothetical protein
VQPSSPFAFASKRCMMTDDPNWKNTHYPITTRRRRQLAKTDPVIACLRSVYAQTLAEPIPDSLADLLQQLE